MKKVKLFSLAVISATVLGIGSQLSNTVSAFSNPSVVYAWDNDDNSGQNNQNSNNQNTNNGNSGNESNAPSRNTGNQEDSNSISGQLKGYKPVKAQDMQNARESSSWLTSMIGVAISFLVIAVFAFTGFITACDLVYMYVPFVRKFLYSAGTDGTGAMTGMGGGGGSTSIFGLQWVSDEAVAVSSMLGGSAQATGHAGGGIMGGGFGGGYGGGFGGGFGAQPNDVQQKGGKSAIRVYVGKRVVALTFLGIASVLLFTSAFTDFGINVGGMLLNLLAAIQDKLSGISFGG